MKVNMNKHYYEVRINQIHGIYVSIVSICFFNPTQLKEYRNRRQISAFEAMRSIKCNIKCDMNNFYSI